MPNIMYEERSLIIPMAASASLQYKAPVYMPREYSTASVSIALFRDCPFQEKYLQTLLHVMVTLLVCNQ